MIFSLFVFGIFLKNFKTSFDISMFYLSLFVNSMCETRRELGSVTLGGGRGEHVVGCRVRG